MPVVCNYHVVTRSWGLVSLWQLSSLATVAEVSSEPGGAMSCYPCLHCNKMEDSVLSWPQLYSTAYHFDQVEISDSQMNRSSDGFNR